MVGGGSASPVCLKLLCITLSSVLLYLGGGGKRGVLFTDHSQSRVVVVVVGLFLPHLSSTTVPRLRNALAHLLTRRALASKAGRGPWRRDRGNGRRGKPGGCGATTPCGVGGPSHLPSCSPFSSSQHFPKTYSVRKRMEGRMERLPSPSFVCNPHTSPHLLICKAPQRGREGPARPAEGRQGFRTETGRDAQEPGNSTSA